MRQLFWHCLPLSLDLILGYAGIVSLGHAAFLGAGAYAAGLLAIHVTADPLLGLGFAMVISALLGFVTSPLVLKGNDLTRIMVTLGIALLLQELANAMGSITGGADGLQGISMLPILGLFEFDIFGKTAYLYSLSTLFVLVSGCAAAGSFPFRPVFKNHSRQCPACSRIGYSNKQSGWP